MSTAYTQAGVDIEAGDEVVRRIKDKVKETHTKSVLTGIGSFGALYDLKEIFQKYEEPVLVQSIDGVGTKLIVARMMGVYDSVGKDIVNHSCNDIVAMGAKPITFLDYVAHEKLVPEEMEKMVWGMAEACKENHVALVGGETAEMPGTYQKGEHDIAGCITGVVDRKKIITGETIAAGDVVFGFASNGLHTNGYSLARKILFETAGYKVDEVPGELGESVGEALLKPHMNYTNPIHGMLEAGLNIKGIAHITGGGFDNITRVLPQSVDAKIMKGSWPVLPIFSLMQEKGGVSDEEMHQVFNMGIGMTIVVDAKDEEKVETLVKSYPSFNLYKIGTIEAGSGKVIIS
ncbi:MAG: phosphoribosylformylglycinamidine cyclo-ligase [Candidatus Paceibacterota bacterium]|jgi:phosphoribosylformylglycinamidine cyclo-ligase